jgi:cation diffusion facilitator family transporter
VSVADKPADEDHQYGHGKMENVSALFETVLLLVTCGWIIWEAIARLISRSAHVEANVWSYVVVATAIVIDYSRSKALYRVAKKYDSQALEADALHFSSDIWSSLTVLAGLVFVSFGYQSFDALAAMGVAILVLFVSYRLGRRTIDALMDRVPADVAKRIDRAIRSVEGISEVRSTRVRMSGARVFVDTIVGIRRTLPFEQAHWIMDEIERAVHAAQPGSDVTVHAEPLKSQDETIMDSVRMVVIDKGLRPPHNLEVHQSGGRYFVDFDVEYSAGSNFVEAHAMASEIEEQIKKEIPAVERVTIHLEEFLPEEAVSDHATEDEPELYRSIEAFVRSDRGILGCKDITILKSGTRYHVALTCQIKSSATLAEVHQIISQVETRLYQNFPQVQRFMIHAEPMEGG